MRRLILKSFQSPGDVLMLTAAVRDLHAAHPGQFQTDVRTSADGLWLNNPHITPLQERASGVATIEMHYPLIHESNQRPYHFLHGYPQFLEKQLDLRIPLTRFHGDVHLSSEEKSLPMPGVEQGVPERFWIIIAGGKHDFTAKWWNPASYQAVVDHFQGRIQFIQCGEAGHWHPPLSNVVNLVGKTSLREFIRLMYHADGVVCPVTFAMHLAAAVETKPGQPKSRACVVIAGGREPTHWEAYPTHQYISMVGMLPCCESGGCWKSRCQQVGDGDAKDRRDLCEHPVQVSPELRIPKCLDMISPEEVIRRIELYLHRQTLPHTNGHHKEASVTTAQLAARPPVKAPARKAAPPTRNVLIEFRHGLGDAVQLTIVLAHLAKLRPDWCVDVAALRGKHSAFEGLCRNVFVLDKDAVDQSRYNEVYKLDWHEANESSAEWPSTKSSRCLKEVFSISPQADLCRYQIQIGDTAKERASNYLTQVSKSAANGQGRFPVVLIHYEGNTSGDRKNLPHDLIREVCETVLRLGFVPVILDWDRRSRLPDGTRIHNPGADHELWSGLGTGDAETLAALIQASSLMIGVDSGPLHVAGATSTPTIGVWTHHHPTRYFDLADNVLHMVPGDHEKLAGGPAPLECFRRLYRSHAYKHLYGELPAMVESLLTGESFDILANKRFLKELTATGYNERYYQEHKLAGLDYLNFGDWHREYGRWFVDSLGLKGRKVLDVGCACGAILRGLGQAGAIVQGVELNEYMVQLGRTKWPDMAPLLHVCDAVNLHLFTDGSWNAIHSSQVAEHWKPELVPFILRELARVVTPGGLFFAALDTEELFARQGRTLETEDPTHVCIRTMSWWHEQLAAAGWQVCSTEFEGPMRDHSESFLKRYDWDWFVARKIG